MLRCRLHSFAGLLALAGSLLGAAPPAPSPLPARLTALAPASLLPADLPAAMRFRDAAAAAGRSSAGWDDAPGASRVLRIHNAGTPNTPSDVNVSWRLTSAVAKGDVCLVRFSARTLQARQESGEALLQLQVQPLPGGGERSLLVPVSVGPDWTQFDIPFPILAAAPADGTLVQFAAGFFPQTIELASLEFLNFEQRATVAALPLTRFTYAGREPGAAWRQEALERIARLRTAPLTVRVTDRAGNAIDGAHISARLVQPAFLFGSCVDARLLGAETPEAKTYRDHVLELFDTVTIDNGLKWPRWGAGPAQRAEALRAVEWITTHGLRLRGHTLVWPAWKFSPRPVVEHPQRAEVLAGLIAAHIRDVVTATVGKTLAWDVLNEPVHERDYFSILPETQAAEWFKRARESDPGTQLFVNEYGMLNSRTSPEMIAKYLAFVERLRVAGAPLDGLGVQGHVGRQVRAPADVLADLDLLAQAKLPLHITEFDLNTPDESLQADYTRDFLIACYSHPAVTGFIMWGFWQPRHWKPDAALFRADWSGKPNAAIWRDLVLQQWRTRGDGATNARGEFALRGHLGRYDVTVTHQGHTTRRSLQLARDGTAAVVTLP